MKTKIEPSKSSESKILGRVSAESIREKYFYNARTVGHIIVPPHENVANYVRNIWGSKFAKLTPPVGLEAGKEKKVRLIELKKGLSAQWCVESLKDQDIIFPNAFGLAITLMDFKPQIHPKARVWGLDKKENLCPDKKAFGGFLIPFWSAHRESYEFNSVAWNREIPKGDYILVFCDED